MIPARAVNDLIDRLAAARPAPGSFCELRASASGYSINALEQGNILSHPWRTSARWDANVKKWMISVLPGFVNGIDATVNGIPLLDAPEFMVEKFAKRTTPIEQDGPIPVFFKELGAAVDASFSIDANGDLAGGMNSPNRKCLQSVDIYLSVARAAINGTVFYTQADSGNLQVNYAPVVNDKALIRLGTRARILQTPFWKSSAQMTPEERYISNTEDIPSDELLVATLYFLSPPGLEEGSDPDDSWICFLQHALFYNLCHAPQRVAPVKSGVQDSIVIQTGLPFADAIGNTIQNQLNDAFAQLHAAAAQTYSLSGLFWSI
jgi:hypothetical protein